MLNVLKALDVKKSGILQQVFCSVPQVLRFLQARTLRKFTPTAPQLSFAQRHA